MRPCGVADLVATRVGAVLGIRPRATLISDPPTYAVLSLTVVRILPVALAPAGTGMRLPTVAYVGWFGPRGLASVVFGLLLVEEHVPGTELLGQVIAVTIGLSILLHGMSAPYFADLYGNWYDAAKAAAPDLREAQDAPAGAGKQHSGSRRLR
ncbi:cation:proton antiporter domain-containing protein [Streptomyces sp. NPDC000878]